MKFKLKACTLFLATTLCANAQDQVLITALREKVPEDAVGEKVKVLSVEEAKTYSWSLGEVFLNVPGIFVSSNGGWGKSTSVYPLGLNQRHLLVLFDGVPINDPSTPDAQANFEWIDFNGADRIEIIEGPQSAVYGSTAVGGVVNFVPEEPKKNYLQLELEGGKYKTFREEIKGAVRFKEGFVSFNAENFKSLYFSVTNTNPDHDSIQYTSGMLRLGYKPRPEVKMTTTFLLKGGYGDYDDGKTIYDRFFFLFSGEVAQSENLFWKLKLSNNEETRNTVGEYRGITRFFSLSPTYYFSETSFVKGGVDYEQDTAFKFDSSGSGRHKVNTLSVYGELFTRFFENLSLTLALRNDRHSMFGHHTTYKISASYLFPKTKTVLKGQYGTGFKAPTISELFFGYPTYSYFCNSNLKPEKSEGYSLGIIQNLSTIKIGTFYFKNRLWNAIDYVQTNANNYQAKNIGRAITEVFQPFVEIPVGRHLFLRGSYTHTHVRSSLSKYTLRRPEESFEAEGKVLYKNLLFKLWLVHYGSRKDLSATLKPFTVYNAYASYKFSKNKELYLKLINLTDKKYELAQSYNTMGRSLFVGLRFKL